jgi:ferric-dicitrate binding protein FerR (iron transport regulator)
MIPAPPDDLILRYLAGRLTADEAEPVRAYLAQSDQRRGTVQGLRTALAAHDIDGAPPDRDAALRVFLERLNREFPVAGRTSGIYRSAGGIFSGQTLRKGVGLGRQTLWQLSFWIGGIGAVILLALGIHGRMPSSMPIAYTTHTAEQRTVHLADGTRVVLAPQSQLTVSADFGTKTRTVSLLGEAYFDITQSAGHPFLVHTGRVSTRVLGTTFDIRHYRGDTSVQIAVQSGKVVVQGRGAPFTLSSGKMACVTDSTIVVKTVGDSDRYADWTTGRLVFDETPLPMMLTALGRWYGYEFRVNDSVLVSQHVSAEFKVSDPAEMMLVLKSALGVTLTFHGNVITLTPQHEIHRARPRLDVFTPSVEIGR